MSENHLYEMSQVDRVIIEWKETSLNETYCLIKFRSFEFYCL